MIQSTQAIKPKRKVTKMAVEATSAKELELEKAQAEADIINKGRSGIGTRLKVGMTRGRGTMVIKYEQWDESLPETLPKNPQQFMDVVTKDADRLAKYLIAGHNDELYTTASDPLAEFVEPTWPDDAQTQFRLVVRNYSRGANVSIEDAVALIKPGFVSQFSK